MATKVYTLCLLVVGLVSLVNGTQRCNKQPKFAADIGRFPTTKGLRPNIIFFLIDDLGYNDIGYHDCSIKTPAMDKLATEGMILENNYMAPLCSPSRGAMLTGKYSFTIGQQHGAYNSDTPDCLAKDVTILPQALKNLNYKTYMVGKWHEGYCNESCLPTRRGFDEFYGFYNGYTSHFSHEVDGFYDWRDQEAVDYDAMGQYDTEILAARAVRNIRDHATKNPGKPMYLYFAFPTVHTPLEAPGKYVSMYLDEPNVRRRMVKAMVSATDEAIDIVVRALKQYGLYDNSIIAVSSDNGGEAGYSYNHPLRGAKATSWEGGVRVPGFFHSPLMADSAKGTISKGLFHGTDWYPTFVSLAGGSPAANLNGYDQSRFLLYGGNSSRNVVPIHYDQHPGPLFGRAAIRAGRYKLIMGFPGIFNGYDGLTSGPNQLYMTHLSPTVMTNTNPDATAKNVADRNGDGGLDIPHGYNFDYATIIRYSVEHDEDVFLFDLETDPTETTNLVHEEPLLVRQMLMHLQNYAAMAVPIHQDSAKREPEKADPRRFGGAWSTGWC